VRNVYSEEYLEHCKQKTLEIYIIMPKYEESLNQQLLINWFLKQYPRLLLFSIPNGCHLGARGYIQAARLKREGLRAGVPDLFLAVPSATYNGMFLEMKSKKGKCSPEQIFIMDYLRRAGYYCVLCYSFEAAQKVIKDYLGA
jgi:hypothetical protein